MIGPDKTLVRLYFLPCHYIYIRKQQHTEVFLCQMIDANQRWDVSEAIGWVSSLAEFKPLWIEEPTCPDDILGHAAISKVRGKFGFPADSCVEDVNRLMGLRAQTC